MRAIRTFAAAFALAVPLSQIVQAQSRQTDCGVTPICFFSPGSVAVSGSCHQLLTMMASVWWRHVKGNALGWCLVVPDGVPLLPSKKLTIQIDGYAWDDGGPEANQLLSESRAESIASVFQEFGIPADKLSVHDYGDRRPLVPSTDRTEPQNRRVELLFKKD